MTRKSTAPSGRKEKSHSASSQAVEPLLKTKLFVPSLKRIVARPRLVARMESGLRQQSLILVSAPPGYGKTTLVAEAVAHAGAPCAWLALDDRDNDPVRFSSLLIAALRTIDADIGQTAESLLALPQLPLPEGLATCLLNDLSAAAPHQTGDRGLGTETGLALVFDDYHTISHPFVHSLVEFLAQNAPPLLHIVIITRQDPPFALSRLRVRGQMTEIRADDLRFTREEAEEWFNRHLSLSLSEAAVTVLQTRTEGWIAGLQLAGVSLQGRDAAQASQFVDDFGGSDRYVMDYLLDEVLHRQTEEMRSFLRQTAILDRFNASLCDAVTQRTDSKALLNRLEQMNLFLIPLDRCREWYRYHHLFGDFLRTELNGAEQEELHRRAADWYSTNGFRAEAIEHALLACDLEVAAVWIEQAALGCFQRGQVATLSRWLEALPHDLIRQSADLIAYQGSALVFTGQVAAAAEWADASNPSWAASPASRGRLLALRASLTENWCHAEELAQQALELIGEDDTFFRIRALEALADAQRNTGNADGATRSFRAAYELAEKLGHSFGVLTALTGLIPNLSRQGRRREALSICHRVLERLVTPQGQLLRIAGLVYVPLGILEYAANELDAAEEHTRQGLALYKELKLDRIAVGDGEWTMVQILCARGEFDAALALAQEARHMAETANNARVALQMESIAAHVRLKMGDLTGAGSWAEEALKSFPTPPDPSYPLAYFILVRALLAEQRIEEAQLLLGQLYESARKDGLKGRLIQVHILQAVAHHALGNHAVAVERLRSAVEIAAPEGYVRPFLDEGPAVLDLLPHVRDSAPSFVDRLLVDFGSTAAPSASGESVPGPASNPKNSAKSAGIPNLVEPLSDREIDVLRLLADGKSNAEIAQTLVITLGTAKWHVHNLLNKLGVDNRAQAIVRAQEMCLL